MVTDLKYTDNIVLKRQAYQELLTGIKHYPIIDVDYIEEWDTDERTNRLVWSGYTDGSPCIKITYGDPQTVKGNIIFSKEFRKAINELNKDYESLQNAIAAKEAYLERLRQIYNDNNEILIREQTYLNAYEDAQLTEAASDAEELNNKLAQLIQMMVDVAHANPQTGEQFEAFGQNTVTEINFTKTNLIISGTAWTTAMLETDPDIDIFYMPSRYTKIEDGSVFYACNNEGILEAYKHENGMFYKLNSATNEWTQIGEFLDLSNQGDKISENTFYTKMTGYNDMYVFTPIRRVEGLERKANENIGEILLYHDYDNIRINVAIPLYRMAYSKYVAAGLGPNHRPANPDEQAIYNFYNNIVEFINLLEAYETNWGTFKSSNYDGTTNPDYRTANIGSRFISLQNWVRQYINQTFIKELTNKCLVTAEHYNINYHGGSGSNTTPVQYRDSYLGMQERLGEVANLIDVYEGYVDSVASGKTVINPEWVEIYNDGDIQWYEQLTENYIYDSTQEYYKQPNSDPNNLFNLETAKQEAFNEIKNRQDNRVRVVDKDNGQEAVIYNSAKSYIVQFVTVVQGATTVVSSQTLEEFTWLNAIDKGLYVYKENASVSDIDVNRVPGVIDNDGSGTDRRMFGYKYIPVGNEIDFFDNLLGVNYNPSRNDGDFIYPEVDPQSSQRYGTFRTTINGHTYEIGIRGLEQSDEHDIKIIASNYEQVPKNAVYDVNTKYYYLDDNGNYVEYNESIHGLWNTARNSDRLFTKPAAGKVQIEASDEITGTAPEISFGGDNINLIADDHMIQYAGEDIATTAGQQITIDAPIVNINGQDNLNITSINEFSYEQVPEGTPYDPNEKYYQQDENGKYIRYIYDPNTWEQDVADGKVYTKFLNEPTEIHYGDINILGQDVYVRDPNDDRPIEERGLGKIHAVADYAVYDDSEYYIINTNKTKDNLSKDAQGRYLIPINSLSPNTPKEGYMIKTPDPENAYFLISGIIDGDKTDENTDKDTCVCIYLGNNITPTAINNKFIRLDGKNLPFLDNDGNIIDADGNIITDENTPDIIKYLNKFLTGRYVRITGDTMTGELIINLGNTESEDINIDAQEALVETTTLEKQVRNITELRYNENGNNIKNSLILTFNEATLPINISNDDDDTQDSIDPQVNGLIYVKPNLADTVNIINNYVNKSDVTTMAKYKEVGVNTKYNTQSQAEELITYNVESPQYQLNTDNFHISITNYGHTIQCYPIEPYSTYYTKFYVSTNTYQYKLIYNGFLSYEKLTPHSSYRIYNPNVSTKNNHIIDVSLSSITIPVPEYTILGIDSITQMEKGQQKFSNSIITSAATDGLKFSTGENTEFSPYNTVNYVSITNTNLLNSALPQIYSQEYFGNKDNFYKIMPLVYTDVKIDAYLDPLNSNNNYEAQATSGYPNLKNKSSIYLGNNEKSLTYVFQPVYFVYWGREYTGTDDTLKAKYPALSFLKDVQMTRASQGVFSAPIYNIPYSEVPTEELASLYYKREFDDETNKYVYTQYDFTQTAAVGDQIVNIGEAQWTTYVIQQSGNSSVQVCKWLSNGYHSSTGIELKENDNSSISMPSITFFNFLDKYKEIVDSTAEIDDNKTYYYIDENNQYIVCDDAEELETLKSNSFLYTDSDEETVIKKLATKINSLNGLYSAYKVHAWIQHYNNYMTNYQAYLNHKDNLTSWNQSYSTLLELEKSGNFIKTNFNFVYDQVFKETYAKLKNMKDFVKTEVTIPSCETVISIKNSYTGSLPKLLTYTENNNFIHYFSYYDENYPNDITRNIGFLTPSDYFIITATRPKIIEPNCRKSNGSDMLGTDFSIGFNEDGINLSLAGQSGSVSYENFYSKLDSSKIYKLLIKQISLFDTLVKNKESYQTISQNSFIINTLTIANNQNNKLFLPYEITLTPKDTAIDYSDQNLQFGLGFTRSIYENYINWKQITYNNANIEDGINFDAEYINNYNLIHNRIQHYVPYYYHLKDNADNSDTAIYEKENSKFIYKFRNNSASSISAFKLLATTSNNSTSSSITTQIGEEEINYQKINNKALEVFNGRSEFNSYVSIDLSSYDVTKDGVKYGLNKTQKPIAEASALNVNGAGYFSKSLVAARVYNAVFNDYAECRTTINLDPGHAVIDMDDGSLQCTTRRLQPGAQIISDTYGTSMGETETTKTPLAVAGRVLAYPYRDRDEYHAGMAVCSAPNGTVDIMTREEIKEYPDCIIGIVSEIPNYKTWGTNNVEINNRIWIKVK